MILQILSSQILVGNSKNAAEHHGEFFYHGVGDISMDNLFSTRPSAHYVNLKFFRTISLITAVAVTALSLNTICSNPAYANTNSAATSAINSLKTQHHYKPGEYGKSTYSCISKGQDWLAYKPASTNCKAECWAFATGVSKKLFGNIATPSGIATKTGYKATNIGNYSTVASRTWPSYNNMVDASSSVRDSIEKNVDPEICKSYIR